MKLIGPDFYNISDLLTEEELFIQKTANEFVTKEFKPLINEHFGCHVVTRDMIYTHFTRPEKSNKRIFRNGSIKIERERMPTKGELAQMELAHIESLIN